MRFLSLIKKIITIIILPVMVIFGSSLALAQDEIAIKISPITFKYKIDKDQTQKGVISVINPNDFSIEVESEVEDFLMENEEGVPKFLPQGAGKTTLASWVSVSLDKFSLAAQETKEVSFTISVPSDAEPGGHYAAIFFKTIPGTEDSKTQLGVSTRVGALTLVSVPGNVSQGGEIVEFATPRFVGKGPIDVLARFKNTGTVHYQLGGTVKICNWFGKEVAKIDLPEHIVLPDSIRRFEAKWETNYLFGKYTAKLEMTDGAGKAHSIDKSFFAFPWKEGLIVLGAVLLLLAILMCAKKKFKIVKKNELKND